MNYPIIGGPFCGDSSPPWCPDDDGYARVTHPDIPDRIFVYRLSQLRDRRAAWTFQCSAPLYRNSPHA